MVGTDTSRFWRKEALGLGKATNIPGNQVTRVKRSVGADLSIVCWVGARNSVALTDCKVQTKFIWTLSHNG